MSSQQPAWGQSREFEITTRSVGRVGLTESTTGDLEDEDDEECLIHGRKKRKVAFMPSAGVCARRHLGIHLISIAKTRHTQYITVGTGFE